MADPLRPLSGALQKRNSTVHEAHDAPVLTMRRYATGQAWKFKTTDYRTFVHIRGRNS